MSCSIKMRKLLPLAKNLSISSKKILIILEPLIWWLINPNLFCHCSFAFVWIVWNLINRNEHGCFWTNFKWLIWINCFLSEPLIYLSVYSILIEFIIVWGSLCSKFDLNLQVLKYSYKLLSTWIWTVYMAFMGYVCLSFIIMKQLSPK